MNGSLEYHRGIAPPAASGSANMVQVAGLSRLSSAVPIGVGRQRNADYTDTGCRTCTCHAARVNLIRRMPGIDSGHLEIKETVDASHQAAYTISTITNFTMLLVYWVVDWTEVFTGVPAALSIGF